MGFMFDVKESPPPLVLEIRCEGHHLINPVGFMFDVKESPPNIQTHPMRVDLKVRHEGLPPNIKAHPTWVSFGCSMSGNAAERPKPTERGWIGGF